MLMRVKKPISVEVKDVGHLMDTLCANSIPFEYSWRGIMVNDRVLEKGKAYDLHAVVENTNDLDFIKLLYGKRIECTVRESKVYVNGVYIPEKCYLLNGKMSKQAQLSEYEHANTK